MMSFSESGKVSKFKDPQDYNILKLFMSPNLSAGGLTFIYKAEEWLTSLLTCFWCTCSNKSSFSLSSLMKMMFHFSLVSKFLLKLSMLRKLWCLVSLLVLVICWHRKKQDIFHIYTVGMIDDPEILSNSEVDNDTGIV
jgi:hypothetical protein